jgi:hypothetical protein
VWLGIDHRRPGDEVDPESRYVEGPYFAHPHCWPFPPSELAWRRVRPPAVIRRERFSG